MELHVFVSRLDNNILGGIWNLSGMSECSPVFLAPISDTSPNEIHIFMLYRYNNSTQSFHVWSLWTSFSFFAFLSGIGSWPTGCFISVLPVGIINPRTIGFLVVFSRPKNGVKASSAIFRERSRWRHSFSSFCFWNHSPRTLTAGPNSDFCSKFIKFHFVLRIFPKHLPTHAKMSGRKCC